MMAPVLASQLTGRSQVFFPLQPFFSPWVNLGERSSSCNSEQSDDLEGQKVMTAAKVPPEQADLKTYGEDNAREHVMTNINAKSCKSPILPPSGSHLSSVTTSPPIALDTPPPTPSPILPRQVSLDRIILICAKKIQIDKEHVT